MTTVKICGITETSTAQIAASAGADFLGLVFAASRRWVGLEKATEICREIHLLEHPPEMVGVFVNMPAEKVNYIAETCRLDRVQISGDETWQYCQIIDRPVIKVLHIREGNTADDVIAEIEKGFDAAARKKPAIMLDSGLKGTYGGTGRTFDWRVAKQIAARFPIMIAGGITPENVRRLIEEVKPWGVDVSSGVETNGQKDLQKIREFIKEAKRL